MLFGHKFVVLYVEPVPAKGQSLTTNTARTAVLLNGQPLPWDDWAYEFRENMPKALAEFVNEKAAALTEKDHSSDIKERLKIVMDLFQVRRYRPSSTGPYRADASSSVRIGRSPISGKRSAGGGGTGRQVGSDAPGQREGEVGNIYHLFEKSDGVAAGKSTADPYPVVRWVSLEDGSRTIDDGMDDKAATFLRSQNTLLVNA